MARPTFRRFDGGGSDGDSSTAGIDYVSTFHGEGSDRFGRAAGGSDRAGGIDAFRVHVALFVEDLEIATVRRDVHTGLVRYLLEATLPTE